MLLFHVEGYQVVTVGALVCELLVVLPRYLASIAHVHQCGEKVVVAVTADTVSLVGVYLEVISHLVACTAALLDGFNFGDVDWFRTQFNQDNMVFRV